nr:RecName: Full=Lombricine kinase; Short=LK [Lumbricus terrestris]
LGYITCPGSNLGTLR